MLTSFRIHSFRSCRDVPLTLTPLHVFVGPPGSGKSTVLEALAAFDGGQVPVDYPNAVLAGMRDDDSVPTMIDLEHQRTQTDEDARFGRVNLLRLDHRFLGVAHIPSRSRRLWFRSVGGFGLAQLLLHLRDEPGREAYSAVEEELRKHFPAFAGFGDPQITPQAITDAPTAVMKDGRVERLDRASEGLRMALAFFLLPYLDLPSLLAIVAPETGLHPLLVKTVMGALRQVVERGTQVILETESPLVLNECQPEEVTVLTLSDGGETIARPITASPNFELRSEVYSLGELWLSYTEGPLFSPDEPPF